mmetsp:Transcript_10416/g.23543  ORF Transcript_10416/g.23543 Transcript_10416/m.23543 type:complete len:276 (+) Transcript_10416:297-1124(+)
MMGKDACDRTGMDTLLASPEYRGVADCCTPSCDTQGEGNLSGSRLQVNSVVATAGEPRAAAVGDRPSNRAALACRITWRGPPTISTVPWHCLAGNNCTGSVATSTTPSSDAQGSTARDLARLRSLDALRDVRPVRGAPAAPQAGDMLRGADWLRCTFPVPPSRFFCPAPFAFGVLFFSPTPRRCSADEERVRWRLTLVLPLRAATRGGGAPRVQVEALPLLDCAGLSIGDTSLLLASRFVNDLCAEAERLRCGKEEGAVPLLLKHMNERRCSATP